MELVIWVGFLVLRDGPGETRVPDEAPGTDDVRSDGDVVVRHDAEYAAYRRGEHQLERDTTVDDRRVIYLLRWPAIGFCSAL